MSDMPVDQVRDSVLSLVTAAFNLDASVRMLRRQTQGEHIDKALIGSYYDDCRREVRTMHITIAQLNGDDQCEVTQDAITVANRALDRAGMAHRELFGTPPPE
jgi:hypothetical protein